jgi:hypothetical protein
MSKKMLDEAIQRTLSQRAGESANACSIAEATISTWHQAAVRLAPLIGTQGVQVLFRRSLHLTSAAIPWIAMNPHDESNSALLASLQARLADREAIAAIEAGQALLVNFTDLLAALIGESLTERLLAPVWTPPSPESEQENVA